MYLFHNDRRSPNHGAAIVPHPARFVVLHWWGNPVGQNPWGIIDHLCNPASQVSAHAVVWPENVAQILEYEWRSWANGNDWANNSSITIECDPNHIDATISTVVEYLADMVRSGHLTRDFELRGHRDYYATECPGAYYPRLAEIRQRVYDNLDRSDTMSVWDEGIERPAELGDHTVPAKTIMAYLDVRVAHIEEVVNELRAAILGNSIERGYQDADGNVLGNTDIAQQAKWAARHTAEVKLAIRDLSSKIDSK